MKECLKFYINGEWVNPSISNDLEVINPSNEEACAVISLGDSADTNAAVLAAKNAFISWSKTTKEERIVLLKKLYEIYKSKWNEMSEAISTEMGAPIDWSTEQQCATGSNHIKTFIKTLNNFEFEKTFNNESDNYIAYEPIGVCALITPWNWPVNQITLKVMPALAQSDHLHHLPGSRVHRFRARLSRVRRGVWPGGRVKPDLLLRFLDHGFAGDDLRAARGG